MNYSEAIQFLYGLRMFGAKFGLQNTQKLAGLAGNPQQQLRFIHVAGTNGKGSTCAMLESIYRAAGLRVGLFTSPHLVSFCERLQVNRELIPESDVIRLVERMQTMLSVFPVAEHPTFFEVVTVMALQYFAEQKCDLVIWETGLGGRLDATNIVTPLASVITNVQYDHQKWLGDTLSRIAFEKAGIIKPGIPVTTAATEADALAVIRDVAARNGASLREIVPHTNGLAAENIPVSLLGEHQKTNAALAIATVKMLAPQLPVSEAQTRRGLETVFWPGRLQLIRRGAQTVLLDGAHNLAGIDTLVKTVRETFPPQPVLIVGMLGDKDWRPMCAKLASLGKAVFVVPVQTERTVQTRELAEAFAPAPAVICQSLSEALRATAAEPFVVITGSLYLIGESMELLGLSPARNERGLNEWQPQTSNPK